jgi:hypothetical protein
VLGRERRNALRHHQDGPACLQEKTAGIQRAKGTLILPLVTDDDEIGGAAFAREQLGRKIQSGSPFRPAIELADRSVKLLPFPAQESFHVLKMKILRRPVVPRLFGKEDRHRRPACDADQVSAKSLGKVGGYGDTAPQLGVDIDVHHKGRVRHRSSLQSCSRERQCAGAVTSLHGTGSIFDLGELYCADRRISLICIKTANPLPWLVQVGIGRVTLEYGTWVERRSGWWR